MQVLVRVRKPVHLEMYKPFMLEYQILDQMDWLSPPFFLI